MLDECRSAFYIPVRDEASCRAYLQVLLIGAAMLPCVENHSALGRSDLEVDAGSRHWVLELKYARTSVEVQRLLAQAVSQLRDNRYGESAANTVLRLALIFDATERRFAAWSLIDELEIPSAPATDQLKFPGARSA